MEIRIRLVDGETLTVRADPDELAADFREALRGGGPLDLRGAAGPVLAVNPAHILWWEHVPWESAEPAPLRPLRAAATSR